MSHLRDIPAHRIIDDCLPRGVGQVVVAADDMGDAHVMVVHDDRMHVGGVSVRAKDDEIVEVLVWETHVALDVVPNDGLAICGRLDADCGLHIGRRLGWVAVAPAPVIARRPAFGPRPLTHLGKLFGGGITFIGLAEPNEFFRYLPMPRSAAILRDRLSLPVEAEPGQAVENCRRGRLGRSLAVGILDAQQHRAPGMAGIQPVEQRGSGSANMQVARWRRGKAGHDCLRHGIFPGVGLQFRCSQAARMAFRWRSCSIGGQGRKWQGTRLDRTASGIVREDVGERAFLSAPADGALATAAKTDPAATAAAANLARGGTDVVAQVLRRSMPAKRLAFDPLRSFRSAISTEVDRGTPFLVLAVLFMGGPVAYFAASAEPAFSSLVSGAVALAGLVLLSRSRRPVRLTLVAGLTILLGVLAAKVETWRAGTRVLGAEISTRLTGQIAQMEHQANGRVRLDHRRYRDGTPDAALRAGPRARVSTESPIRRWCRNDSVRDRPPGAPERAGTAGQL